MKILHAVGRFLHPVLRALLGELAFSWRPPLWLRRSGQGIARRPRTALIAGVLLIGSFVGGLLLWNAWKHRPVPLETDWIVQAPGVAQPSKDFEAQPLTITFDRSVAELSRINKPALPGVTLSPPLAGDWHWDSGSSLVFEPRQDWPPGTEFQITLAPAIFSPHALISTLTKSFRTAPFTAQLSNLVFYINPKDPATKQITATLTFSHAVDRSTLEKNLRLDVQGQESLFPATQPPFALAYDLRDRVAYLRSASVALPNLSTYVRVVVPQEVAGAAGGTPLSDEVRGDVLVPSQYDLFHVLSAQVVIVQDKNAEPEQALVVGTSVGVKPEALEDAIHAYVLPPRIVDGSQKPWDGPAQITAAVLARATPVPLTAIASEETYTSTASFHLKAPEKAQLFIRIDKGLKSLGDFPLGDAYTAIASVPTFDREVRLMYDGSLLALNGERKLSVSSRGVEQLEYRLARINPGEINHLVSQSQGNFSSPIFNSDNFGEADLSELIVQRQAIAVANAAQHNYSAFDFSDLVKDNDANQGKLGLFILHLYGRRTGAHRGYYQQGGDVLPDAQTETRLNWDGSKWRPEDDGSLLSDSRLILVTDLALIVKDNADQTHDVFVQSIRTGGPVEGAKVQVLGRNGLPLVTVETDGQGRAPIPSLEDFVREKEPVAYVAQRDRDVSFLPFGREDRELNLSRFDTSGLVGIKPEDLSAFVFTDRGIYRPGDEVKLGLILKQHNWRGNLQGVPLDVRITDPRGQVVQEHTLRGDATGFLEDSFHTRETSLTGEYQVSCLLQPGGNEILLGNESFRVREFLPDRLKITTELVGNIPPGWIAQKGLQAKVTLRNLYGTAAAGHRIKGKLTLTPAAFSFEKYADFSFVDPYLDPNAQRKYSEVDLPEQTTSDTGEAVFDLATADLQPSAYQLSFLAEGFEKEGGRSVTSYASVLVSPSAWLLGTKPDGDFSYVDRGSRRSVRLLAVDPWLKPVAVEHLTLKLVERRYVAVLVQQPNGNYAYESVLKELPVAEKTLAVAAGGSDWPLDTRSPGDFAARFYNEQGDLMADVRYSVAGAGNLARALEKNAELTAKLSKPEYRAGEEIEVQITAPYTGAGLITIERDKVYATQWFQAKSTSTIQKIRLPADFEGNGYVNVTFARGLDSHEIYMSPLSYTVLPFKVDQEARHTRLTISAPALAVPGQPLNWTVQADRPTRAVVYAVDEGILQVAGYHLPDPLAYFFRKEALGVGTRQTVDQILPEYSIAREVSATGGDAGGDLLAHHLNPFKRKHDLPVAYWSGVVDLGPQAKSFTYRVPDYFAGTVRLMVVAASPDAVGSAEDTLPVRGPFVISPNVPTFVAPGDRFDLSVTVANNIKGSGADAGVDCFLATTDGLEIVQKPAPSVTIAEGKDASLHWILQARNELGNADITVTAHHGGATSSLVSHLSVRPPVAYFTTLNSGYFVGTEKRIDLTRRLYPQFHRDATTVSVQPQGFSRGLGDYLEHYEYGCTEQLISKAFPTLVSDRTMSQGLTPAQVQAHLEEIYSVLASRENDQGAFGYWAPETDAHFDFPSLWAVQLFTEAKERGYEIPEDMLRRGLDHLRQVAEDEPATFEQARNQAQAIYLLTRNGVVTTNFLEHNRAWFEQNAKDTWGEDIAGAYTAASYAMLKNQRQADALIGRFHLAGAKMQAEDDYDDELDRDSCYIDLLAHHFPERLRLLKEADLMALARPIMDGDYTTLSAAQAILALDDYSRAVKGGGNPLAGVGIDEVMDASTRPLVLTPGLYPSGSFDPTAEALVIHHPRPAAIGLPGLFYQIVQSGFESSAPTTPISEGIEISREYHDKNDQPTTTAHLGDELKVVLRVRGTGDRDITNVAILDLLPGGFEVVPESIQTGACQLDGIAYEDVREDRVAAFGTINSNETEITYRIKATNQGAYAIPPPQAEAMYHLKIRARGVAGQLTVTD